MRGWKVGAGIASLLSGTSLSVLTSILDSPNFQRLWTMRASEGGGGGKDALSVKNVIGENHTGGGRTPGCEGCGSHSPVHWNPQPPTRRRRELKSLGGDPSPAASLSQRRRRPAHSRVPLGLHTQMSSRSQVALQSRSGVGRGQLRVGSG